MNFLAIIVVLSVLAIGTLSVDYCNPDLCPDGGTHIGCNNAGTFSANCPDNAQVRGMTTESQELIVDMINVRRNRVALGELSGFQPATKMGTVKWDPELQRLAQDSARRCTLTHDACRNTFAYKKVGQLVFQQTAIGVNINYRNHLIAMIQRYFQTYLDANQAKIDSFQRTQPDYSPFAILVNEKVTAVGCATVSYKNGQGQLFVNTVCNFSSRNEVGKPVYVAGVSASACATGPNPAYPGLCSTTENIDPNA